MHASDRDTLRNELQFLKNCQVQYFVLSAAATGAIAGFGDKANERVGAVASIYLAPLLIILPCWWIFFDKATTISRIVAFVRLLELGTAATDDVKSRIPGWETALHAYREQPRRDEPGRLGHWFSGIKKALRVLALDTTHKYWAINWWAFAGLSTSCLWLSYAESYGPHPLPWRLAFLLALGSAAYTLSVVGHLANAKGSYSYVGCFDRWMRALGLRNVSGTLAIERSASSGMPAASDPATPADGAAEAPRDS